MVKVEEVVESQDFFHQEMFLDLVFSNSWGGFQQTRIATTCSSIKGYNENLSAIFSGCEKSWVSFVEPFGMNRWFGMVMKTYVKRE